MHCRRFTWSAPFILQEGAGFAWRTGRILIIDDFGLRPLEGDEPIDLCEVFRARYERGSVLITSNRSLEEWYPLFLDDLMASAAMDRLLHHAHTIVMEGDSFRNPSKHRGKVAGDEKQV